jgi:hypothetical protein
MKISFELDEDDLRQAVIMYLKQREEYTVSSENVYFRIEKEEGCTSKIICTASTYSTTLTIL